MRMWTWGYVLEHGVQPGRLEGGGTLLGTKQCDCPLTSPPPPLCPSPPRGGGGEPSPAGSKKNVQLFKTMWDRKKKFYTVPVQQ